MSTMNPVPAGTRTLGPEGVLVGGAMADPPALARGAGPGGPEAVLEDPLGA